MPRKRSSSRLSTSGVNFEEGVLAYLDELCETEERSRSYLVNKIIKEHARGRGVPIRVAPPSEPRPEA